MFMTKGISIYFRQYSGQTSPNEEVLNDLRQAVESRGEAHGSPHFALAIHGGKESDWGCGVCGKTRTGSPDIRIV